MSDKLEPTQIDQFLQYKVLKGFRTRGYPLTQPYTDRINEELDIICQMKFGTYFLIVADLCNWMERQNILFIVRGSGCGSLVVWGLGISHAWLDPIEYGLPFERFLNPERVSMPDLDIDIQDDRRDEVVEYTLQKYGRDRVAKIVTFGTMAAKNAIKDVGRGMGYTDHEKIAAEITQFIPAGKGEDGKNIRLADEITRNEALREYSKRYPEWFAYAMRLEGKIRNASIHAAGTIIAPDRMTKFCPTIFWGSPEDRTPGENFPTTQWDMYDAEEARLLKMDYLGLKTLRVVAQTCEAINLIKRAQGEAPDFSIHKIDRRDPATWKMLADGRTSCVFQIEKTFVQGYAKRMNLANLYDPWQLAVLVAIIRPGMMDSGNTERYLRRASGQEEPVPLHPLLAETFKKTYGLMCFQEDVMWAARVLCKFTMGKADVLRKGVGKKNPEFITKMKPDFDKGAVENGVSQEDIDRIWANIEDHSRYSFNNAHAAAYGMVIAWWTAYLKCQWPVPFMTFMINSEAGRGDKIEGYNYKVSEYIEEARAMGITILPPSVKESVMVCSFNFNNRQIRFGLSLIKRVGQNAVQWILKHSRKALTFKDFVLAGYEILPDAGGHLKPYSRVSKTDYEQLISAGALDCYENADRDKMLAMLPMVMKKTEKLHTQTCKWNAGHTKIKIKPEEAQADLDGYVLEDGMYTEKTLERRLELERDVTGCYLSHSPFEPYRQYIHDNATCTPGEIRDGDANTNMWFVGVLHKISPTLIKNGKNKGQEMGFIGLTGTDGVAIEAVAFMDVWWKINNKTKDQFGNYVKVIDGKGKVFMANVKRDKQKPDAYLLQDMFRLSNCGFDS